MKPFMESPGVAHGWDAKIAGEDLTCSTGFTNLHSLDYGSTGCECQDFFCQSMAGLSVRNKHAPVPWQFFQLAVGAGAYSPGAEVACSAYCIR